MISNAVSSELISRIVGYLLAKGDFQTSSPNLPQRVAIFGEANTANQTTLDTNKKQITSAQQAGELYGFGSPIHIMARIFFPRSGGGIGGIPVIVYPQEEAVGATAKKFTITPIGVATDNATHTLTIAGRGILDGYSYDVNISVGDSTAEISDKIEDVVNSVLGCPMSATSTSYLATLTSKWKGLTAEGLTLSVNTNDKAVGITYVVSSTQSGSATPSIQDGLDKIQNDWETLVINSYGTVSSVMTALEGFNGIPDPTTPTGRFAAIIMKPFIALTGYTGDDPTVVTDSRLNNCTIQISPAPLSPGLPMEAAANDGVLRAVIAQNTPELDTIGKLYPDMPVPSDGNIGSMASYTNRNVFLGKGSSTVSLNVNQYEIQDPATTYHKLGENPPQFRYTRNLILDFNVRYGYYLLEQLHVVNKVIAGDNDTVTGDNVIKPKQWKQILFAYFDDLVARGLITDASFSKDSLQVGLSTTNPDRLETSFEYKRTGVARIASTTAFAGFNFGTVS